MQIKGAGIQSRDKVLNIESDVDNYNVFVQAGEPDSAVFVQITIQTGVLVGSANTGAYSFDTGALLAGSTVKIILLGSIIGKEGLVSGADGGPAMNITVETEIDLTGPQALIAGAGGNGGQDGENRYGGQSKSEGCNLDHITEGNPGGSGRGCTNLDGPDGNGGDYGQAGRAGSRGTGSNNCYGGEGGEGGQPGKAIDLNGNTLIYINFDEVKVKGVVA